MKTLYDKIWDAHVVHEESGKPALLYIDLHLIHEVTSPQAFEGLRLNGRQVRRPERTFATVDHTITTVDRNSAFHCMTWIGSSRASSTFSAPNKD